MGDKRDDPFYQDPPAEGLSKGETVVAYAACILSLGCSAVWALDDVLNGSKEDAAMAVVPGGKLLKAVKLARLGKLGEAYKIWKAGKVARLEFPTELIPKGENQASWGAKIWGRGADDARDLVGARTAKELREIGLDGRAARTLADFYRSAAAHGRGAETARARVALMKDIEKTLRRGR